MRGLKKCTRWANTQTDTQTEGHGELVKIGNPALTNQKIQLNLYFVQIWCIFLQKQSQCPHFKFGTMTYNSSTEIEE